MEFVSTVAQANPMFLFMNDSLRGNASYEIAAPVNAIQPVEATENNGGANGSDSQASQFNSFESPAAELILTTGLQQQIRGLSISAQSTAINASVPTAKMNEMMKQCFALRSKASTKSLSQGQKTYIQTEIDRIKRSISGLDIAL